MEETPATKNIDETVPLTAISQKIKDKAHKEGKSNAELYPKDIPPLTKQGL